ncbi:MAG: hypothetical protein ACR2LS_06700 [Thermomicrobiales bacterium]
MPFFYEVVDLDTGSIVGSYQTRDDALAIVRVTLQTSGIASIRDLAIAEKSSGGKATLIAEGEELLPLLEAAPSIVSG